MTIEAIARETSRKSVAVRYRGPAGVFACAFVFLILTMDRTVDRYDEGLILFGSVRVLFGDMPYRDFYANYGPAQFYVLAALFKMLGPSVLIERLWDLVIRSCTALVIFLTIYKIWSRKVALFVVFLIVLLLSSYKSYGYPVFPCLLFSLLSLYFLVAAYGGNFGFAPLLASGICVGIAILFRYDFGILPAVAGAFTLGLFHITQKLDAQRRIEALLRSTAVYVAGIALALAPALALIFAAGGGHDMVFDLFILPSTAYVQTRSLPFPSIVRITNEILHLKLGSVHPLAVYLPLLAAALGVFTAFFLDKSASLIGRLEQQALTSQRRWILVQLSILSLLFFVRGSIRVDFIHMAPALVCALVIISLVVWDIPRHSTATRILSGIGFACLLVISVPPMVRSLTQFARNVTWAPEASTSDTLPNGVSGLGKSENVSCFPPAGLDRIRCFPIPQDVLEATRYIQEHTEENDAIFVGMNRHDNTIANDILFYFLSKRLSATKWHHFDPGVQDRTEIQLEIIAELRMRRPQYIVLTSRWWDDVQETYESAPSSRVTPLDRFIQVDYRPVASFGGLTILEYQGKSHGLTRGRG